MNKNESPPQRHPLNGVTLTLCATPSCSNGVRASREIYCDDCRARQAAVDPEATPETTLPFRLEG